MVKNAMLLAIFSGAITLTALNLGSAQVPSAPQAIAPQSYLPSLADLMTTTIQPRHIKLGLAGQEKNWPHAAYELGNLKGAFDRAAHAWPIYRKTNMADLIEATIKSPMEDVAAAIKAADAGKFKDAYEELTGTCNACHESTDHGLVIIRVPKQSPYPDQDFRPIKP
jgi:cytochrome c553